MALCRTPELGTAHWECETCGHVHDIHNPCRDRHCGSCGEHLVRQWYDAHSGELLPLAHQHVVFTAPHELHVFLDVWENRRVIYPLYLRAARDALVRVAGETLGIMPGQAAFLHTWNQWMLMHLHIHTIWPNGGWLIDQPDRFVTVDATQLDEDCLINAFRDALLNSLCRAAERGRLVFGGQAAFLDTMAEQRGQDFLDSNTGGK